MNPYQELGGDCFWKLAVASKDINDIEGLWKPKFNIKKEDKIVTYGSCFAQHIGRALRNRGFCWTSNENPPIGLSEDNAKLYNYNVFSSRSGNIYTTSLLRQWTEWALGMSSPSEECWEQDGRYYDPFRPRIEPNGFESKDEMMLSRLQTIASFKEGICSSKYFIFTLGLTESWFNSEHGYEYPMCPGTVAGEFDPKTHAFKNQQFHYILKNLSETMDMMRAVNKQLKFILTVSPVPLTATCSGNHVLIATMESKSILRAVAGQLRTNRQYVDYFPSYEIITSPIFKGAFFRENKRDVTEDGVNFVMNMFFNSLNEKHTSRETAIHAGEENWRSMQQPVANGDEKTQDDIACEEELLGAFGVDEKKRSQKT